MKTLHAVTGAFGYSGGYIARRLLAQGNDVLTLTNSPRRPSDLSGRVRVYPLAFDDAEGLANSLKGVRVLYNTYWVRFDHGTFTHEGAVRNTLVLFEAAKRAGVERVVHVSITNPEQDSPLPYFAGKARLEQALQSSGLSHSILRPAVLFGPEDILIHNIAWTLRRFPLFGVFGSGQYGLRPIHVEDLAGLAVSEGERSENRVVDAVGPESYTFRGLVEMIGRAIGCPRPIVRVPTWFALAVARLIGWVKHDVFLTREEIAGLTAGLLQSRAPSTGAVRLSEWVAQQAPTLGTAYASEMHRRVARDAPYVVGPR